MVEDEAGGVPGGTGEEAPQEIEDLPCPRCDALLPPTGPRCVRCGLTMKDKGVYEPKRFFVLGALFSALVPIYMSASNWGGVGRKRARSLWLAGGALGFILLIFLTGLLPSILDGLSKATAYGLNGFIGYRLGKDQHPVYEASLRLGAHRRSLFKGSLLGVGYSIGVFVVFIVLALGVTQAHMEHGRKLLQQDRFAEAATVFQTQLHWEHDNPEAVFDLAVCQLGLGNADEAAAGFEHYLRKNDRNAFAYAILSELRLAQGRHSEADSLAAEALALDPNVFTKLKGMGDGSTEAAGGEPTTGP